MHAGNLKAGEKEESVASKAEGHEQMEVSRDNLIIVLSGECGLSLWELQALCRITTLMHEFQINHEESKGFGLA